MRQGLCVSREKLGSARARAGLSVPERAAVPGGAEGVPRRCAGLPGVGMAKEPSRRASSPSPGGVRDVAVGCVPAPQGDGAKRPG